MSQKEYCVNIGNLKISGSAEEIHNLAFVYGTAALECENQIVEEIHGKHRDNIIIELQREQKKLEEIEKQLIDTIRDSDYYKKYSSEMSNIIDKVLEEIEEEY